MAFLPTDVARKKNGRFQRENAKRRSEKMIQSRKRKSNEIIDDPKASFPSKISFPLSGRRVVELDLLAKELASGCKSCGRPLLLSNCTEETNAGLGSFLYISCGEEDCGELNVCRTNKTHRKTARGRPVFDVNTKLAAGMLHAGIGATHVNALLASLNIPAVCQSTIKAREREIGPVIEKIAKESCSSALQREKSQWSKESFSGGNSESQRKSVGIGASYDMGWQKRGRGHNSLTGAGTMIGLRSGKVIAYATRNKRCAVCEAASRRGEKAKLHDCRLNWCGSSKAMEADTGAQLAQECTTHHNAEVVVLVGDDDSATIKKVRDEVSHSVEKWSDINHAKKTFTSHLYALQPQFKGHLSNSVIDYFTKCFGYALVQNKNDAEGLKRSLRAIVPHAFGKHDVHCNVSWCGFLQNPSNYRHASLPHGKDLQGEKFQEELENIMESFIESADKLAPLGSSQANEAMNNTIGSKAPKIRHYGASESNDFRVARAVSQKNIGHTYVSEALSEIQLSPGLYSQKHAKQLDRKMSRLRVKEKTREFKKRRRESRSNRCTKVRQLEAREGTQYKSGLGFSKNTQEQADEIPPPTAIPITRKACISDGSKYARVLFDLETSSRGDNAEICQLAAIYGSEEFNVYVLPSCGIAPSATAVNKLAVKNGCLFYAGRPVPTVQLDVAISRFLSWLKSFKLPCLLLAHNVKNFDAKHLQRALEKSNKKKEFSEVVLGYCDTLPAFKELFPNKSSYSQENLARELLKSEYNAHNALYDVQVLQELSNKFIPSHVAENHSFSFSWYQEYCQFLHQKREHCKTLEPLIHSKAMSKGIADKAAASGLSFAHLLLAFQRGGIEGLSDVLREKFKGKSRVTNKKQVIVKICSYFTSLPL